MPRRFHDAEELFPPATLLRRLLAIVYDGLICIAVLLVVAWIYTLVMGWIIGWERYEELMEAGAVTSDLKLTFFLFLTLYLFFAYFWTHTGQTLGMQVWRIRIENLDGVSISWSQSLRRYVTGALGFFIVLIGLHYLGAITLIITGPVLVAMFYPHRGQSVTDWVSGSVVVQVPKT